MLRVCSSLFRHEAPGGKGIFSDAWIITTRRRRALPPLRGAAMTVVRVARTLPVLALLLVCAGAVPSPEW